MSQILLFSVVSYLLAGSSMVYGSVQTNEVDSIKPGCLTTLFKSQGCCYKGKFIREGGTLQISGCETCNCERGKPICFVKDCAKPPAGCSYTQTATECCKLVCGKGCYHNGIFIPEGESRTVAPCQYGYCDGGRVMIAIADCAPPPAGCQYQSTMEDCCKLVCEKGCYHNGIFIPEGESRTVAPCHYGYCDGGKVMIAIADCAPPPAGCQYHSTMEECCKLVCTAVPIDPPIGKPIEAVA